MCYWPFVADGLFIQRTGNAESDSYDETTVPIVHPDSEDLRESTIVITSDTIATI